MSMMPLAIIGLDPGTTAGYAILDLHGRIIAVDSSKELSLSLVISKIIEVCRPVFVSTDKARVPSFVEHFARKMGVQVISPQADLKRAEKRQLLGTLRIKDDHQQDSLAAAYFAYKQLSVKLSKINRYLAENSVSNRSNFILLALKDEMNFSMIKEILSGKHKDQKIMVSVVKDDKITKKDFLYLHGKLDEERKDKKRIEILKRKKEDHIKLLKRNNNHLLRVSSSFSSRLRNSLKFKNDKIRLLSKQLQKEKIMNKELNIQIGELYDFIQNVPSNLLVKRVDSLGKKEMAGVRLMDNDFLHIKNPHVYSEEVLACLSEKQVVLLSEKTFPSVIRKRFSTNQVSGVVAQNDKFSLLEKEVLMRSLPADFIENLVRDYRKERKSFM